METQWEIQKNMTVYNFDTIDVDGKPEVTPKCLKRLVGERGFEPPAPLLAAVFLWTAQQRFGLTLLTLSMTGSLIFGLYHHFGVIGTDQVGAQAFGPWAIAFAGTAYLLSITEAIGTYIGVRFLCRPV